MEWKKLRCHIKKKTTKQCFGEGEANEGDENIRRSDNGQKKKRKENETNY